MELRPANERNSADLPSMTGSEAGADIAEAEHRRPVADDHHEPFGPGVLVDEFGFGGDGAGDLRDAGRVGDGQVALGVDRRAQFDGQFAADVCEEDLVVGDGQFGDRRLPRRPVVASDAELLLAVLVTVVLPQGPVCTGLFSPLVGRGASLSMRDDGCAADFSHCRCSRAFERGWGSHGVRVRV